MSADPCMTGMEQLQELVNDYAACPEDWTDEVVERVTMAMETLRAEGVR